MPSAEARVSGVPNIVFALVRRLRSLDDREPDTVAKKKQSVLIARFRSASS
jgi:hypothetical protein